MKRNVVIGILLLLTLISGCANTSDISNPIPSSSFPSNTDTISLVDSEDTPSDGESIISSEDSSSEIPVTSVEQQYSNKTYQNTLFSAEEFADPTITYDAENNAYYMYATGGKYLKSIDLVDWYKMGNVFKSNPIWGTPNAGLWAPDVTKIGDNYVMYYSLSTWGDPNPGIGVAVAKHPEGPWTDRGSLFRDNTIGVNNSIDAHAFIAETGEVYLVWGSMRGNYMIELTADGLGFKDGSVAKANANKIHVAGLDTSIGWTVDTYEGAYVMFKDGYYYLMLSTGTCCNGANSTYKVITGRSQSPTGPFYDKKGDDLRAGGVGHQILQGNDHYYGPGHHTVLKDAAGEYWMYYHTYTKTNTNYRVLALDKLIFDNEGWPYISGGVPSNSEKSGPTYKI